MKSFLVAAVIVLAGCTEDPGEAPPEPCHGRRMGTVCGGGDVLYTCGYTIDEPSGVIIGAEVCEPGMCRDGLQDCVARLGSGTDGVDPPCVALEPFSFNGVLDEADGYCDGQLDIRCDHGYAVRVTDCGLGRCRSHEDFAVCVQSETANPICDDVGFYTRCDGQTLVHCVNDLVVAGSARSPCV